MTEQDKDVFQLSDAWLQAKEAERMAVEARRAVEDELIKAFRISEQMEGIFNAKTDNGHHIKIVGRLSRKVDADKVQELAAEHGLTEHLSSLFRWKPEINATAWKATSPEITVLLADAVTVTASRPSFSITLEN
ncbi:MAG TPA: hypothetical protein VLA24_06055 [Pseudomonadales bacterium]|nr:hypothetical protein [Pseudomonadales bacterium]